MRIISGSAKGLILKAPSGLATRPTADRVREALFDIIGTKVSAAKFLDLFAGSGAVGIEALSRGAASAVFVEKQRQAVAIIAANLKWTNLEGQAEVLVLPVDRALKLLAKRQAKFDLVFLDPPYKLALASKALELLVNLDLIAEQSWLIAETLKAEEPPEPRGLHLVRRAEYGQTALNFYQPEE